MPKPENIIGKGFDKHPENINRKGRPPKLISHINKELEAEGFTAAKVDEITTAYLTLINLPISRITEIANIKNDEYPILYKLVAKEIIGKRGADMLEKLLDRGIGRATQQINMDVKTTSKPQFINLDPTYQLDENGNIIEKE